MEEKLEEMREIIAKAIREYLEEEGITQLYIKGRKDGTSTKIISKALYNAGYRKESDTAREILSMVDCIPTNEVNELNHLRLLKKAIADRYGVGVE